MVITKKQLGCLVKEARKVKSQIIGKRYTQQMLADDIGKSQSYIGDIESGRTYPTFLVLNAIATACEVPIGYFQDENRINKDIDNFIKIHFKDLDSKELYAIREQIKKDPDAKINHIYDSLNKDNNLLKESNNNYVSLNTPENLMRLLLSNPVITDFLQIDITKITEEEISDFAKKSLEQLKLISYKYKK
ncbi:XRE family transcriptional regulator [Clostridium tetani]|uniref:helix-turn-helix domain-containing protein n=1 Tax=Clostridium tetani TaxID=1513 RepID=UPI00100BBE88|nr:helix-turn-helix transcriptional regulator [Clostridium tetani]RXI42365.1 XRE family transcriptional regulator [Clostridium tetani]